MTTNITRRQGSLASDTHDIRMPDFDDNSLIYFRMRGEESTKKYKTLWGIVIVVGIAISWVGSTQFAKSTYTDTFNAPWFTVWFSTSWISLFPSCFPRSSSLPSRREFRGDVREGQSNVRRTRSLSLHVVDALSAVRVALVRLQLHVHARVVRALGHGRDGRVQLGACVRVRVLAAVPARRGVRVAAATCDLDLHRWHRGDRAQRWLRGAHDCWHILGCMLRCAGRRVQG